MEQKIQEQIDQQLKTYKNTRRLQNNEKSNAPLLNAAILEKDYKRTAHVEIKIDGKTFQVEVLNTSPLATSLLLERTPEVYALSEKVHGVPVADFTEEEIDEIIRVNRDFQRNMVASHIVNPSFSYYGHGNGHPIEDISDSMLEALFQAYSIVNAPGEGAALLDRFPEVEPNEDRQSTPN